MEKKKYRRLWAEKNRNKLNEYNRIWYKKNKNRIIERKREIGRKHYFKNKISIISKKRPWRIANYWKNRDKILKERSEYYLKNRECIDKSHIEWAKRNPDKVKIYAQRVRAKWVPKNKHKIECHREVRKAVRKGDLLKPENCSSCNKIGKVNAHHNDYTKPLEVVWLCHKCHKEVHK